MAVVKKDNGIEFRLAMESDINAMAVFEKDVWGDNAADRKKICSRIRIFPEGNIIALYQKQVVGYISFEYVDDLEKHSNFSWAEITDYGRIANSHKPDGKYIYGVTISVHRSMNGKGLSALLMIQAWGHLISNNKAGVFLGSRIPGFKNYKKLNPDIDVNDYVGLVRNGKPRDYELRMYGQEGLLPVKILPDYFPDEASLNYGVLLFLKNPFYRWPFRKVLARIFMGIAPFIARNKVTLKKRR